MRQASVRILIELAMDQIELKKDNGFYEEAETKCRSCGFAERRWHCTAGEHSGVTAEELVAADEAALEDLKKMWDSPVFWTSALEEVV